MNYLAHLFLSGNDEELLLGNFMADAVKGRQAENYPAGIIKGIRLHRLIDTFTDTHPVVHQTKARLRLPFRKFAPVVADMYFDHFLASRFDAYSAEPLPAYAQRVYQLINARVDQLPPRAQHFFTYMMRHKWLESYAEIAGISRALEGMSRRTSFVSGMENASVELQLNYDLYAHEFEVFFPELVQYVAEVKEGL